MLTPERAAARRRAGRWTAIVLGAALVLFVAVLVWVGARTASAASHLTKAQSLAAEVGGALSNDPDSLNDRVDELREHAQNARDLTSGPVWTLTEQLPWAGPHLRAVSTLSASLEQTASDVVAPLANTFSEVSSSVFAPQEGRIDLASIESARDNVTAAHASARAAADAASSVDTDPLVSALREPAVAAAEQLEQVASLTGALENATALLPPMLGADEEREYLLIAQNNAEWRSLGGVAGSLVLLRADDGRVEIVDQASATALGRFSEPSPAYSDELDALFGHDPETWMHNVTQVPDFEVTARLASDLWERSGHAPVDGVVALDPVALSYLVGATGPVELPTGDTATKDTLVPLLLSEVYARYPEPAAQDAAFGTVTGTIFDAVMGGRAEPAALLTALARAGDERRLLVWSAHDDERSRLADTTLSGALPESDREMTRFGVYLNDGTGSKMDYYMDVATGAAWCTPAAAAGRPAIAGLRVELESTAPADAATSLPPYVTGANGDTDGDGITVGGAPVGSTRTVAYIYLPQGATVDSLNASVGSTKLLGQHDGRSVVAWSTILAPGEAASLDVSAAISRTPGLDVVSTPTIQHTDIPRLDVACEPGR